MNTKNLPKLNVRKTQSTLMIADLKGILLRSIKKFEEDNKYELESYEIDKCLLEIIDRHHELYLREKFGNDLT